QGVPKNIRPWNVDRLEAFKKMYNVNEISVVIIDEMSMLKPWMLAYLDARLREATQCDKMFGGKAVILLGDFDQQPPIGVPSQKHKGCKPSVTGVELFKKALLVRLNVQHRCAKDAKHIALLEKMRGASRITPADLSLYQTLSIEDMTPQDFLFGTTIVTNNYERHEINAHEAHLWAKYHGTRVVWWKRRVNVDAWQGKPTTDEQMEKVERESCFWEYFVPQAPAYLSFNLNTNLDLANGTEVRLHSLAFDTKADESYFRQKQRSTAFGDTINLPVPPRAINVELYPDLDGEDESRRIEHAEKREQWQCGSITNDGLVVFPVDISHQNK
ncbi:hypothetical protein ACHAWF_000494, partial [Thalassiosira exigua]